MRFQPKNLLVPTDFSKSAHSAFLYALALAKANNGRVSLVHAYRLIMRDTNQTQDFRTRIKKRIDEQFEVLKIEAESQGIVDLDMISHIGFPKDVVSEFIDTHEVDLIIMGSSGTTIPRKLLGGTVRDVALSLKTPILAIPEGVAYAGNTKVARKEYAVVSDSIQHKLLDYITDGSNIRESELKISFPRSTPFFQHENYRNRGGIVPLTPPEFDQIYKSQYNRHDRVKSTQLRPVLIEQKI